MNVFRKVFKRDKEIEKESPTPMGMWLKDDSCDYVPRGYRRMSDTPEIKSAVEKIAEIVSSMTIYEMENTENGDIRVKDGLAKFIDIKPNLIMNRQLLISWIVQEMILYGNAIVKVITKKGYIYNLVPIEHGKYQIVDNGNSYMIMTNDRKILKPDEVLHFRYNPDLKTPYLGKSQEIILKDLINNLSQATTTIHDFLANQLFPTVVVKVDAMVDDMKSDEGRDKIETRFLKRSKLGKPWIVPSLMGIEQIKPLTLNDIAINERLEIDKRTVASIIGVPAYMLGIGDFNREEYNNFIKNKISVICKAIEQELTRKLLLSETRYFKFNRRSMLSYDLQELGNLYLNMKEHGVVTGNEVRDVLDLSPLKGLDELIVLENYIPVSKVGEQNKLNHGGG